MTTIQDMLDKLDNNAIAEIKDELFVLYKQEIFTKQLYLTQLRKFDGQILSTLTYLSQQEEMHANTLKVLIDRINYPHEEEHDLLDQTKKRMDLMQALNLDVKQEEVTQNEYETAIKKSTNKTMKELLTLILEQEYEHLRRLNEFVEKNKNT
jgi:rubrerythrin